MDLIQKKELPIMEIISQTDDEILSLKLEEETMLEYLDTVYNIHMPDKNHGYVEHFKKTGIKEKGNQKLIKKYV